MFKHPVMVIEGTEDWEIFEASPGYPANNTPPRATKPPQPRWNAETVGETGTNWSNIFQKKTKHTENSRSLSSDVQRSSPQKVCKVN